MENRFGFKDFVLVVLLVALLVSVWLAMIQYDRQWTTMQQMSAHLASQAQQLNQLNQAIKQGITSPAPTSQNPREADDNSFERIRDAQAMPGYAMGDWYIDVFGQTVGKLTPHISSDVYQSAIARYVMESLAQRDPVTLEWQPMLAKSWDISPDGLTITFEMRQDARFADGQPVTAKDVVFSYELIMNPKIDAPRSRAYYEKIQSVTAPSQYQVIFILREPYFLGFSICAGMEILPEHFYGQFTEEQFNASTGLLFGSGPYQLSVDPRQWKPGGGKIELIRNERYWGPRPAFDRLVWREMSDPTARLTSFRNGEVDRFGPSPEQYLALRDDKEVNAQAKRFEFETITSGYRYVGWNQQRDGQPSAFADKRVRQAMAMLANREEMAERLMVGLATVATGPFHPLGKQADPSIEPWPYDPAAAKALLKDAGWEDRDGDGIIENQQHQPFRFKLIYPAGSANYKQIAFYLKDAYARAGIAMEPDPLEWTIMIQRINDRQFDAITLGWGGTIESDPYQIFHSDQIALGGDNYVGYVNKDLDALIDAARVTVDDDERMKLWQQVHQILHIDQPYTFLFNRRSVLFIDRRIENVQRTAVGLNSPVEWFVPVDQQKWTR